MAFLSMFTPWPVLADGPNETTGTRLEEGFAFPSCERWKSTSDGKSINAEMRVAADDWGELSLNDKKVGVAPQFGTDSGWVNVEDKMVCGKNVYRWSLRNTNGGPAEIDVYIRFVGLPGVYHFWKHWKWLESEKTYHDTNAFVIREAK